MVSEFTRQGLDNILCRRLDIVRVKGKHKAVAIYEPVCAVTDADDQLQSELGDYEAALSAYHLQQWDRAEEAFAGLVQPVSGQKAIPDVSRKNRRNAHSRSAG